MQITYNEKQYMIPFNASMLNTDKQEYGDPSFIMIPFHHCVQKSKSFENFISDVIIEFCNQFDYDPEELVKFGESIDNLDMFLIIENADISEPEYHIFVSCNYDEDMMKTVDIDLNKQELKTLQCCELLVH